MANRNKLSTEIKPDGLMLSYLEFMQQVIDVLKIPEVNEKVVSAISEFIKNNPDQSLKNDDLGPIFDLIVTKIEDPEFRERVIGRKESIISDVLGPTLRNVMYLYRDNISQDINYQIHWMKPTATLPEGKLSGYERRGKGSFEFVKPKAKFVSRLEDILTSGKKPTELIFFSEYTPAMKKVVEDAYDENGELLGSKEVQAVDEGMEGENVWKVVVKMPKPQNLLKDLQPLDARIAALALETKLIRKELLEAKENINKTLKILAGNIEKWREETK